MNGNDQPKGGVAPAKGLLSAKIISLILVGFLMFGSVPATHSYPSAKADFNNFWLAAKGFWDSLELFRSLEKELTHDLIKPANTHTSIDEMRLETLKTHPECRSIYISEFLPTANIKTVLECEKLIEQHEQDQLFDAYVEKLCENPASSSLSRHQIGEIQLRLRKYALLFPQAKIELASSDVDGLYGSKTCQVIASYQIVSKLEMVNGSASDTLYNNLAAVVSLSEQELSLLSWQPAAQTIPGTAVNNSAVNQRSKSELKLPNNPFKRVAFCLRNSHLEQCVYSSQKVSLAQTETYRR